MSSSDWDEVKRLAADFQRAQLANSIQRLSERNCVELINKLQELELLKLHYTSDGRCYVTAQQLHKEILDELYVAGGRINLVDLSSALSIDLSIIEEEARALLQDQPRLQLLQGQIIATEYEESLAEEISEKLLKTGRVAVEDLAAEYELPGDFIRKVLESRLGSSLRAVQDSSNRGCFYTEQYLSRIRSRIRGLMTAVTVPTPLHKLMLAHNYNERLFMGSVERLVSSGRVSGDLVGSKQSKTCTFVPALYSRTQTTWADNFLLQNGYLEFEFLRGLGIEDPVSFISRRYSARQELLLLPSVAVGQALLQQLLGAVEEAIVTHTFVNVAVLVPCCFSDEDRRLLVEHTLQQREAGAAAGGGRSARARKGHGTASGSTAAVLVLGSSFVVSQVLVASIKEALQAEMTSRGHKLVAAGGFRPKVTAAKARADDHDGVSKKDERRRKAAGGKAGSGTHGRETKTRSTKSKKGRGRATAQDDSDEEQQQSSDANQQHGGGGGTHFPDVEFLPLDELTSKLSKMEQLRECEEEEMVEELALELHAWSKKIFAGICESCYHSLAAGGGNKRRTLQQLQDRVLALLTACKLAERGTKEFGPELEAQLSRHLLRTQGSELFGELLLYLTDDVTAHDTAAKDITSEARGQLLLQVRPSSEGGCREALLAAHKAAAGSDLPVFFTAIEAAVQEAAILLPKKKDNKKEKQVLLCHRAGLLEQLSSCCEPALALHLATLLLFYSVTGHTLHASGKFVPHLVAFLKPHLPQDLNELLHEYQGLVMQKLTSSEEASSLGAINGRLEQLTPQLQEKAITFRKQGAVAAT